MAHVDARLKRVAVVGGGWAGLAAAVELCAAGRNEVTVFEAAKQLGGRARSVELDGQLLDNGQHILSGAYRESLRLMRRVGADPDRLLARLPLDISFPRAGFQLRLPHLPAPFNLAIGLFGARGCAFSEKLRAVRFTRALQARQFKLEHDMRVDELLNRHQQTGTLRRFFWEPLCLAALNTGPENASAQIFANVLRDSLGGARPATDLLLPTTDLGTLFPQAAARYIEAHGGKIRRSTRVDAISPSTAGPGLAIHQEIFDDVIVAVAPQHAASLLADHPETAGVATQVASYTYEPIGTVYASYPPELRLPRPMLGLDGSAEASIGQWVFDRGALACGAPGLLSFVLSGHGPWESFDNSALLGKLHGELAAVLGRELPTPKWYRVMREARATFSCRPGLPRPATRSLLKGLWLAGDYVCADYPATLEGAIRSGVAAAKGIMYQQ